jgi:hypothetical protein
MVENCFREAICVVRGEDRDVEASDLRGAVCKARDCGLLAGKGTRRFLLAAVRILRLIADIIYRGEEIGALRIQLQAFSPD